MKHEHTDPPPRRSFLSLISRWLTPERWPTRTWIGLIGLFVILLWGFAATLSERSEISAADIIFVKVHAASYEVTEADDRDARHPIHRSLLVLPVEGEPYFRLDDPLDKTLEPRPTSDQEIVFGYFAAYCGFRVSRGRDPSDGVQVCRPSEVRVGSAMPSSDDVRTRQVAKRRALHKVDMQLLCIVLGIAALTVIGLAAIRPRRA